MSQASDRLQPQVLALTPRWLVVRKPSGWLTIPPSRPSSDPMAPKVPVLSAWVQENHGKIWVVHRIDRETSGLVLFARTADDHRQANRWFETHQVKKSYDCLAVGQPAMPVLNLRQPIHGQPSITQVEAVEVYREGFLARVSPRSGRRHQIRIHMKGEGHPLWGDREYGGPTSIRIGGQELAIERVALHAARLELPTGEKFEAPWPEDFESWVKRLREGGTRA